MKIKFIILLIVLNHLIGITTCFFLFVISLMILIGIPIVFYLLYFSIKLAKFKNNKKNNFNLFSSSVFFLFYNLIIFIFLHQIGRELVSEFSPERLINPCIYPLVNVVLSVILLVQLNLCRPREVEKQEL